MTSDLLILLNEGFLIKKHELTSALGSFCETHPSRKIAKFGEPIGKYMGVDIFSYYETEDGVRNQFVGVFNQYSDLGALSDTESVISPGLIYDSKK